MTDQTKYTTKLAGARVLITGGTSGLGYGLAEALLEHGATVTISSSRASRVDAAVARLQAAYPSKASHVRGFACDLGDAATLEGNAAELLRKTGALDHLVHTAGDALATLPLADVSMPTLVQAGLVRYFAPILLVKHAVALGALDKSTGSSITFTTGSVSEHPIPGWATVAGYASALHALTRNLALDLRPIRVNLVSPGAVDTELWHGLKEEEKRRLFDGARAKTTTGEVARVEDVVEAYLYALKDRNLTGSMISTNGGTLLV